ncbi:hypothetical protein [Clostridium sp. BJN0001]|uniref:hypothetical protein n=1 Tax=Clostridium sp. BJN0001 TaxID=2930219 RepID=UPI001FD2B28D|nr:hypothetical protein [Clostridium sp. BJN0001]
MSVENIIGKQYSDISNLADLLKSYVDSYRLLIAGAAELYNINIAKKSEVRKAIERAEDVGELIDMVVETLNRCDEQYLKYCKIKNDYISVKNYKDTIFTEIENDLSLQNSKTDRDEE